MGTSSSRRCGRMFGGGLLGLAWLMAAAPCAAAENYFAEPRTGRKVDAYQVELAVARGRREQFNIPAQCDEVERLHAQGAAQWGSLIDHHTWPKVIGDCRFHSLLSGQYPLPEHNHLGGYDFRNAPLFDLPFARPCTASDPGCGGLPEEARRLARSVGLEPPDQVQDAPGGATCKLGHGVFRGRVNWKDGRAHCEGDPSGPGFRILSVHYADVNGDGVLDAVLRMVPLGPGQARRPVLLALTRLAPDQPLTIVQPKVK